MKHVAREQEAGLLYIEGFKAVRAGGHEIHMLASHLVLMINGTVDFPGALWPVRSIPPDNREICLDRFIDYLRKPVREGLGLPSLHFLRQVLKATPKNGEKALALVREELAKEHIDLDAVADQEHARANPTAAAHGGDRKSEAVKVQGDNVTLKQRGNSRASTLARLKRDHPALAARVVAGELSANAAAIKAGFRKKPVKRCPKCGHEW